MSSRKESKFKFLLYDIMKDLSKASVDRDTLFTQSIKYKLNIATMNYDKQTTILKKYLL